ncbi:MAG: hypothetical protein WDZ94_03770 [Patescibacteria group bacterium]
MVNQQVLEYIKEQSQQGLSREQIKSSLVANGWQDQDAEEALSSLTTQDVPELSSAGPAVASSNTWKIIAAILVGVALVGGGAYLASQTLFKSEETPALSNEVELSGENEIETATGTAAQQEEPVALSEAQDAQMVFADKLDSCTDYKTTFEHPLTGDMLEKEIFGIVDGKCLYVEQMPNNGKMECRYSENERVTVAQFYRDGAMAESVGTSMSADLFSGEQDTTYTIDGKVVSNPLDEALNSGVCVVSGY